MKQAKVGSIQGVAGIILAGGGSTRFGTNKALALLDGRPLVEHVACLLSRLFTERLLVTNNPAEYDFLAWPVTGDRYRGFGPLAGIEAALSQITAPRAFVVGCDMPLLDERLLRFLCSCSPRTEVVLPWLAAGPEPLCAVYHRKALVTIEAALKRGERKISRVLQELQAVRVGEIQILQILPDLTPFHNVNYQQDLEAITLKDETPARCRRMNGNGTGQP
jgi:molybdopterin-guanine dinucleotide biosynthesis protein A